MSRPRSRQHNHSSPRIGPSILTESRVSVVSLTSSEPWPRSESPQLTAHTGRLSLSTLPVSPISTTAQAGMSFSTLLYRHAKPETNVSPAPAVHATNAASWPAQQSPSHPHVHTDSHTQSSSSPSAPGLGSRTATRILAAMSMPMRRSTSLKSSQRIAAERGMFSTPEERSVSAPLSDAFARHHYLHSHPPIHQSQHHRRRRPTSAGGIQSPPFRSPNPSMQPPSIAQIAMGLHTSRTPHLGPSSTRILHTSGPASASDTGSSNGFVARLRPPFLSSRTVSSTSVPVSASSRTSLRTGEVAPKRSSLKKPTSSLAVHDSPLASRSTSPSVSVSNSSVPRTPQSTHSRLSLVLSSNSSSETGVGSNGGIRDVSRSRSRLEKFLRIGPRAASSNTDATGSGNDAGSGSMVDVVDPPRKAVRFTSIVEDEIVVQSTEVRD